MTDRRRPSSRNSKVRSAGTKKKTSRNGTSKRTPQTRADANGLNGNNGVHEPRPMPKSRLKPEELETFKELLLEKRRQLIGDVDHMENEALGKSRSAAAGDLSMMPIHMADIGTDNYEQEFTLSLVEGERQTLKEIDAAIQRITEGTYGICVETHKPISKARLKAKPWAKYCIEFKRQQEERERR